MRPAQCERRDARVWLRPSSVSTQPEKRQDSEDDDDCADDIDDAVHAIAFRENSGNEPRGKRDSLHTDFHATRPRAFGPYAGAHESKSIAPAPRLQTRQRGRLCSKSASAPG